MTVPVYDEVGSRTRQAWLRTGLGVLAVTALVVRGLLLAEAPAWAVVGCMVPAMGFLGLAVARTRGLRHAVSPPLRTSPGILTSLTVVGLAVAAVAAVLVP